VSRPSSSALFALVLAAIAAGCDDRDPEALAAAPAEAPAIAVATAPIAEAPVTRYIRVSGTLAA
jgi:hypothetical protein